MFTSAFRNRHRSGQPSTGEQCPICLREYDYLAVLTEEEFVNKTHIDRYCSRQMGDDGLVEVYYHRRHDVNNIWL